MTRQHSIPDRLVLDKHPRADQECGFVARLTTSKDGRSAYDKSDCINPACARCVSMFRGMMLTGGEARHKGGGFKVVALSGAPHFAKGDARFLRRISI